MRRTFKRAHRSGLEDAIAEQFAEQGRDGKYEQDKLKYTVPASDHVYTPDFTLRPKVYIETKGYFDPADRKKHLLVKASNPDIEVRFVFSRSSTKIRKGSPTSYGDWCRKNGFLFADKRIPIEWFKEKS